MIQLAQRNLSRIGIIAITLLPVSVHGSSQCDGATAAGVTACDDSSLTHFIANIINTLFTIIGILAVIILLIGAIRYITSTGDAGRIKQAKETILYALIGLIVAILARAIVAFVIGRVG